MSRWFRMYDELLDDPKAQRLPPVDFKAWVNLLCLASRNEGRLPCLSDIAFALRVQDNDAVTLVERLAIAGLIDKHNGGVDGFHYTPHGWDKRQYKSDSSSDRVKKHRAVKCNVSGNVTVTPPDTDTDTDTESMGSSDPTPEVENDSDGKTEGLKPEHIVEVYNEQAGRIGKPVIRKLTPERRALLRARIAGYTLDEFREVLGNVERSPFLRGDTGWKGCGFDWIFKKSNFQKILEGNYNG